MSVKQMKEQHEKIKSVLRDLEHILWLLYRTPDVDEEDEPTAFKAGFYEATISQARYLLDKKVHDIRQMAYDTSLAQADDFDDEELGVI